MRNLNIFDCFEMALTMMLVILRKSFLQLYLWELILALSTTHKFNLAVWSLFILSVAEYTIFGFYILFSSLISQNAQIQIDSIFFQDRTLEHREKIEPLGMYYRIRYDFLKYQLVKSIEVISKLLQHQRYYKNKHIQKLQKPIYSHKSILNNFQISISTIIIYSGILVFFQKNSFFSILYQFDVYTSEQTFLDWVTIEVILSKVREGSQFLPQSINYKMKNKPLINQSNLPRFQKQNLFIVRPKPYNSKSQLSFPLSRQPKTPCFDRFDEALPTLQQCILFLEQQADGESVMEKTVCLRIRQLLRFKGINEDDRDEIKKENEPPTLNRKQSSKIFRHRQQQIDNNRNRQYHGQQQNRPKLGKVKSIKDVNQRENIILEQKIKLLTFKIQEYQEQMAHLGKKVQQLQIGIKNQILQVEEKKKIWNNSIKSELRQNLRDLDEETVKMREKINVWQAYISEKQSEIVNLYQLLQK